MLRAPSLVFLYVLFPLPSLGSGTVSCAGPPGERVKIEQAFSKKPRRPHHFGSQNVIPPHCPNCAQQGAQKPNSIKLSSMSWNNATRDSGPRSPVHVHVEATNLMVSSQLLEINHWECINGFDGCGHLQNAKRAWPKNPGKMGKKMENGPKWPPKWTKPFFRHLSISAAIFRPFQAWGHFPFSFPFSQGFGLGPFPIL